MHLVGIYILEDVDHHHKNQGLDPLIRSVSRVTTALANVSSVFQLFSFLVVCSDMISKGFGLVAFFAVVKASSVCIHLSCLEDVDIGPYSDSLLLQRLEYRGSLPDGDRNISLVTCILG